MFLCVNESTHFNWVLEDYCKICFYLYSSELVSLGSFVSKRLNLYFEQLCFLNIILSHKEIMCTNIFVCFTCNKCFTTKYIVNCRM